MTHGPGPRSHHDSCHVVFGIIVKIGASLFFKARTPDFAPARLKEVAVPEKERGSNVDPPLNLLSAQLRYHHDTIQDACIRDNNGQKAQ